MGVTARWRDWTSFALGLWLALSPWALGFASSEIATANAALVGVLIALGSHFEASFAGSVAEWVNVAGGLWLVAAPFVLGFWPEPLVAANSLAVGTAVAALAGGTLALDRGAERRFRQRLHQGWQRREPSH